jgi:branched-chain amino acid transport system substrate-binding protein
MPGACLASNTAEIYAATLSFLRAAKAVDDVDAGKVLAALRRVPIKSTLLGDATVRSGGRVVHDVGVHGVKRPDEIPLRRAYYDHLAMIEVLPPFRRRHATRSRVR